MELQPILSAMRRNKVGAILIAVQMAITLAILCNALFIIQQRLQLSKRPTGLDEPNVFTLNNQWVGNRADMEKSGIAKLQGDMNAIRAMPGVIDATMSNSVPLSGGGSTEGVGLKEDQQQPTTLAALYFADEHGLNAMGLKLVAGRYFNADEVHDRSGFLEDHTPPASLVITKDLAEKLFPGGDAVGKRIYVTFQKGFSVVVGVVERLQVPWTQAGGWGSTFNAYSMLEPYRYADMSLRYIVRTQPGRVVEVMKAVEKKLTEVDRMRVLTEVQTQEYSREDAYQNDKGLAVILAIVSLALLLVTAFGIVGLTSYWVAQRRRQIGIRRALGATRQAIVRYFQTENFLIAAAGAIAGVGLAIGLNIWMMSAFAMERLNSGYALIGAVVVLLLGQGAVLYPALRAASIPPALATRGSM
jgi:putative ABC transport system permease protein